VNPYYYSDEYELIMVETVAYYLDSDQSFCYYAVNTSLSNDWVCDGSYDYNELSEYYADDIYPTDGWEEDESYICSNGTEAPIGDAELPDEAPNGDTVTGPPDVSTAAGSDSAEIVDASVGHANGAFWLVFVSHLCLCYVV